MDKRLALVVDDSRVARETLRNMLHKHDIAVDALASAGEALEYLKDHTPDVIFMDHMMPGMDGFQAVEAIKGNPDTATIPIMMYTSREGELYVSQARALGAIGILPKQVEPAELFEVLNKLGLVQERRSKPGPGNRFVLIDTPEDLALSAAREDIREIADAAADSVNAAGSIGHLGEILGNYHHVMTENMHELRAAIEQLASDSRNNSAGFLLPLLIVLAMLIPLLWIYNDGSKTRAALDEANRRIDALEAAEQQQASSVNSENAALRDQLSERDNRARAQTARLYDSISWAINQGSAYELDEEAFSDRRLAIVQQLVSRLQSLGFRGVVQLESHLGEFCLAGNAVDGYHPAPDNLPVTECTLIGHPLQELPALGQRQSIAFANFLDTSPLLKDGDIRIDLVPYRFSRPRVDYPPQHEDINAQRWNRVATLNNRVEVRLVPDSDIVTP
jgi:CheY-like chemotaxis protein